MPTPAHVCMALKRFNPIYTNTHTHTHTQTHTHTHTHTCIMTQGVRMPTPARVCVALKRFNPIYTNTRTHTHAQTHTYTHTHTCPMTQGVRMPTPARVCVALKRFNPNLQPSAVSFNTLRSIITVDMDTDRMAQAAERCVVCRVGQSRLNAPCLILFLVVSLPKVPYIIRVGQNHMYTVYVQYFWQGISTKYTVIYGAYIRFWPTLYIHCMYRDLTNPSCVRCARLNSLVVGCVFGCRLNFLISQSCARLGSLVVGCVFGCRHNFLISQSCARLGSLVVGCVWGCRLNFLISQSCARLGSLVVGCVFGCSLNFLISQSCARLASWVCEWVGAWVG